MGRLSYSYNQVRTLFSLLCGLCILHQPNTGIVSLYTDKGENKVYINIFVFS